MSRRTRDHDGVYRRDDSPYLWISYTGPDGRQVRESAKTTRKGEAKALLEKRRTEAREGILPPRGHSKIEDHWKEYLRVCTEEGERNVSGKRGHFERWISPHLGDLQLKNLGEHSLEKFRRELRAAELGPSTCNRIMSTLSNFIRWAVKKKKCSRAVLDAVRGFERFQEPEPEDRQLTEKQVQRLLEKASPELRPVLEVLIHTGARIGEVVLRPDSTDPHPLEWDRVDFKAGLVVLWGKRNKKRAVPINATLLKVLKSMPRSTSGYVFAREDGDPMTYGDVRGQWEEARKAASVPKARIHDLRHTVASKLVGSGRSLYEVQALLGHTTPITTQRYAHLAPDRLRETVAVLEPGYHDPITKRKPRRSIEKA